MELPPGPSYTIAGNTLNWVLRPGPFMEAAQRRYGDVWTLRIARERWVMLADPDHIKEVFTGNPVQLHAGEANAILSPIVGHRSVLLLDEAEHMAQRKLLLPPFHGERMQRYGELIREIATEEVGRWPLHEPLALLPRMQEITLEVIMRAVFGVTEARRLDDLRTLLRTLLDWTTARTRLLALQVLGPQHLPRLSAFRAVLEPVDRAIAEEIAKARADPRLEQREDILALLAAARYEDGSPMSQQELRDELVTLLVAGHETTATALSWAMERLLRHPAVLDRLRSELEAGEETYLDAVVKETLRLRPVLPIVLRRLTTPLRIAEHELPAGVAVAPCIYLVHRNPLIYPEPERFRPERFLEQPAGTYSWIPFGGGVRRCLGASFAIYEMKEVLRTIVLRAELAASRERSETVHRRAITFGPSRGAEAVLSHRRAA